MAALLLGVAALGLPLGHAAVADEPSVFAVVEPEDPDAAAAAALQVAWATAFRTLRDSVVLGTAAEHQRRRGEVDLVAAHGELVEATRALERATRRLLASERELDRSVEEAAVARADFDIAVAQSYKFSGSAAVALAFAAIQSAGDVNDLSRAMRELEGVLGHSYERLEEQERAVDAARGRVAARTDELRVATGLVEDALAGVDAATSALDGHRRDARRVEHLVLDGISKLLDLEEATVAAELEPPAWPSVSDPMARKTSPGGEEVSVEERRAWLERRRSAVRDDARIPATARGVVTHATCPVPGATFTNDWYFPRSHGRRHHGTDVFADRGAPILALLPGVVTDVDHHDHFDGEHDLGGRSVSWMTDAGRFYASHLDEIPDGLAVDDEIQQGQVIGWMGDSGNARGGPVHLHLGWFVDGIEINPWPTLAHTCNRQLHPPTPDGEHAESL